MSETPQLTWVKPRSLEEYILEWGCKEYEELVALRIEGFEDELLKEAIRSRVSRTRQRADNSTAKDDEYWVRVMSTSLKYIDNKIHCIPHGNAAIRFLDLGCCPGGFSDYILRQNPEGRGVGMSLGQESGGHGLAIPLPQRARFEIHWADLTYLTICAPQGVRYRSPPGSSALSQVPFTPRGFRLVILDGHHRRPQESSSTHPWDIDRLLIAQLIIGLESLERGGRLLVKLSYMESATTARLVYMLDTLSKSIVLFKPGRLHGTRNSFYAVAMGVGGGGQEWKKKAWYLENLKKVWWHMTYDGPNNEGRWLKEEDLDFITKFETLHGPYLERLVKLGKGVWRAQGNALRRNYCDIRKAAAQNEPGSDNLESDPD
ncbi:hypothetical protein JB92DRAFT_3138453 [Gautieria morchelliformis]|nr:hypothetical protein JB92DRAFT_3138453 [Gautieria morchelliformis]